MKEIYKMVKIDEFPNYLISKCGKAYSTKSNKYLTPKLNNSKNNKRKPYWTFRFNINNIQYTRKLHRLLGIAFIDNPKPDEYDEVDHININELDNRLENLRWCNRSINGRNQKLLKRNKSGFQGVYYDKEYNRWISQWTDNEGKKRKKSFPLNKYDNAKELAIEYRKKMVDKYYNRLNISN